MAKKNTPTEPVQEEKKRETFAEFIASMATVLVTGLFIITFNLQAFEIPSSSMENTLLIGDHVFVDRITLAPTAKWAPFVHYRDIRHGDIVVFLSPVEPGLFVVKRVIGIPGDRIHLHEGVVYRNGEPMTEPYAIRSQRDLNPYRDNFPSVSASEAFSPVAPEWVLLQGLVRQGEDIVVPPDHYFAMGDNREVSYDSRYWGFIPRENVIGRPLFNYWSFETPADQYKKTEIRDRLSFLFHVVIHFFDQTRWKRMGHIVS